MAIYTWEQDPYSAVSAHDGTGWGIVFDGEMMAMRYQAEETATAVATLMNMAFREGKRCGG